MAENTHLTLDGANQPIIENGTTAPLNDLMAQATARYAIKDYNAAAELYSRATELQAEINGEMSPHNADLLYAYGRCLYHVAVSNSDVLGSKVAGENRDSGEKKAKRRKVDASSPSNVAEKREEKIIEEGVKHVSEGSERPKAKEEIQKTEPKPYFQFTGDENFDESDEEDEDDAVDGEGQEEAEEDDFSNAYEVLDLARVLLQRRLEEAESTNGKGKMQGDPEPVSQLKERLADTYDLQAEISLEGERFPNAVTDLKAALEIKQHLFPQYSSLLAEAHYKLSLALEFSSVTQQKDENLDTEAGKNDVVDEAMREEAAKEMEEAIQSCKVRIRREEELLALGTTVNGDSIRMKVTRESIDDVKEIVKDMEHRLLELRQPPVSISDPTGTGAIDGSNPLSGVLGSILGESPEAQKARLEEASRSVNDLTGLIKKKKPTSAIEVRMPPLEELAQSNGKRKTEAVEEVEPLGSSKKTRLEDTSES